MPERLVRPCGRPSPYHWVRRRAGRTSVRRCVHGGACSTSRESWCSRLNSAKMRFAASRRGMTMRPLIAINTDYTQGGPHLHVGARVGPPDDSYQLCVLRLDIAERVARPEAGEPVRNASLLGSR